MPFANGDGWQDVQKLVENPLRRFGGAHAETFAHAVSAGLREHAPGARFGNGAQGADGERGSEDSCVVVVHLIAETGVAALVETFELIEAPGLSLRHAAA